MKNVVGINEGTTKIKTLYEKFMEDISGNLEEVISCRWNQETDTILKSVTRTYGNTVFIYNYSRVNGMGKGKYAMERVIADISMFEGLFKVA